MPLSPVEHQERITNQMAIATAARFAASRRLEGRSRSVNLMLALLGGAVIVISILPFFFELNERDEKILVLEGVCAAILVLVLSLYQYSSGDDVNAERCILNGIEISSVRKRLEVADIARVDDLRPYVDEYIGVLKECAIKHERVDYTSARMDTGNYDKGRWRYAWDFLWVNVKRFPGLSYLSLAIFAAIFYITIEILP